MTTTMIDVSARTIRTALKYLYRATPAGEAEQKELLAAIHRLEQSLMTKK